MSARRIPVGAWELQHHVLKPTRCLLQSHTKLLQAALTPPVDCLITFTLTHHPPTPHPPPEEDTPTQVSIHRSLLLNAGGPLRALVNGPFSESRKTNITIHERFDSFDVIRKFLYCEPIEMNALPNDIPLVADRWGVNTLFEAYFTHAEERAHRHGGIERMHVGELVRRYMPIMTIVDVPERFKSYFSLRLGVEIKMVDEWFSKRKREGEKTSVCVDDVCCVNHDEGVECRRRKSHVPCSAIAGVCSKPLEEDEEVDGDSRLTDVRKQENDGDGRDESTSVGAASGDCSDSDGVVKPEEGATVDDEDGDDTTAGDSISSPNGYRPESLIPHHAGDAGPADASASPSVNTNAVASASTSTITTTGTSTSASASASASASSSTSGGGSSAVANGHEGTSACHAIANGQASDVTFEENTGHDADETSGSAQDTENGTVERDAPRQDATSSESIDETTVASSMLDGKTVEETEGGDSAAESNEVETSSGEPNADEDVAEVSEDAPSEGNPSDEDVQQENGVSASSDDDIASEEDCSPEEKDKGDSSQSEEDSDSPDLTEEAPYSPYPQKQEWHDMYNVWDIFQQRNMLDQVIHYMSHYGPDDYTPLLLDVILRQLETKLSDVEVIKLLREVDWDWENPSCSVLQSNAADDWSSRAWRLLACAQVGFSGMGDDIRMSWNYSNLFRDMRDRAAELQNKTAGSDSDSSHSTDDDFADLSVDWDQVAGNGDLKFTMQLQCEDMCMEDLTKLNLKIKLVEEDDNAIDKTIGKREVSARIKVIESGCACDLDGEGSEGKFQGFTASPSKGSSSRTDLWSFRLSGVSYKVMGASDLHKWMKRHKRQCGLVFQVRVYVFPLEEEEKEEKKPEKRAECICGLCECDGCSDSDNA